MFKIYLNTVYDLSKAGSPFASKKSVTNDCLKNIFHKHYQIKIKVWGGREKITKLHFL